MAGIAKCYLGDWQTGHDELCKAIDANREDPHRYRHQRELALILAMDGRFEEASDIIRRLIHHAPDLCRNGLVSAGIYWQAGAEENARHCIVELLERYPDLNKANMREINFVDEEQKERFLSALSAAGLPDE
jgi:tetratricopeptide (TPR) repeat protein